MANAITKDMLISDALKQNEGLAEVFYEVVEDFADVGAGEGSEGYYGVEAVYEFGFHEFSEGFHGCGFVLFVFCAEIF